MKRVNILPAEEHASVSGLSKNNYREAQEAATFHALIERTPWDKTAI